VTEVAEIPLEFVTDDAYRELLAQDLNEMGVALRAKAPKAATVLAGSLLEALLAFALQAVAPKRGKRTYDNLSLDKLIEEARAANLLTEEAAQLSVVVKSYRNLIHPGRARRLDRAVDDETAQISVALVRMVARHLESQLSGTHGHEASAVLLRLEESSPPPGVLEYLIRRMPNEEVSLLLRRELLRALVEKVKSNYGRLSPRDVKNYERAFGLCWERCSSSVRADAARCVARTIGGESDDVVAAVVDAFLKPGYLDEFDPEHKELAVAHLLARLESRPNKTYIAALAGMEQYLDIEQTRSYFAALSRLASLEKGYSPDARRALVEALDSLEPSRRVLFSDLLDADSAPSGVRSGPSGSEPTKEH
jgi:hypothetical protein